MLVLVRVYSGHVQNGIFGIIQALHEILVLTSHVFDLNFDFRSFLALLFHSLVAFGNTGWIRVRFRLYCNGMEDGFVVVGLFFDFIVEFF